MKFLNQTVSLIILQNQYYYEKNTITFNINHEPSNSWF